MTFLTLDRQIAQKIKHCIDTEEYREGQALPSERELAGQFQVNRLTIRTALQNLVNEGLIVARNRNGYYILKRRVSLCVNKNNPIGEFQEKVCAKLLMFERIEANKDLAQKLKVPIGTEVNKIRRLRHMDGRAVSIENWYIAESIAPDLIRHDLEKNSAYEILNKFHLNTDRVSHASIIVYANAEEKKMLGVSLAEPLNKEKITVFGKEREVLMYLDMILSVRDVQVENNEW